MVDRKTRSGPAAELERRLRAMFKTIENRPIPDRLRSFIDQLDQGDDGDDAVGETPPRRKQG